MKLKKLQLQGFKSFADRTELSFDRQIAAVVGPNGCGKSNIVDAIRWAMGEQSAKGLRGHDMADVIFAGTPARKAANFAEVSLIFDNAEKLAPMPYTEVAEIMVTRRLFRSGESEYLINKVQVRLKDINDLFLGTGSSAKAYSIVAQGKVDQVVLAKPEDRRFLIEEAAGVAKYKVRKQAAERKMDATKHNLERVHDILTELEKNARHLERQVERAEKFRELQRELRALDEKIVSIKVRRIDGDAAKNAEALQSNQDLLQAATSDLLRIESQMEAYRLKTLDLEKILNTQMEELLRKKDEAAKAEMEGELAQQRMGMLENQIREREKDIDRLQAKNKDQASAREKLVGDLDSLKAEKISKESLTEQLRAEGAALDAQISESAQKITEIQSEIERIRTEVVAQRERVEHLKSERVQLELKRAELEASLEGVRRQHEASLERAAELKGREAQLLDDLKTLEARREESLQNRDAAEKQVQVLFEAKSEIQKQLAEAQSQREALSTLEQHHVGYDLGALEFHQATGQNFILDLIEWKSDYRNLGQQIFANIGQFFFLDAHAYAEESGSSDCSRFTNLVQITQPVRYERSAMDLVDQLKDPRLEGFLRSIEWVDRVDTCSHACFDSAGRLKIPFENAFALEQMGQLKREQSPFARRSEIEDLRIRIEDLQAQQAQNGSELEMARHRVVDLKQGLQQLESDARALNQSLKEVQIEQQRQEALSLKWQSKLEETQTEMGRLDTRTAEIQEIIREQPTQDALSALQEKLQSETDRRRVLEHEKSLFDSRWIEFRIEFGALVERLDRLQEQSIQAEMAQNEYQHNEGIFRQDIQMWSAEISRLKEKAAQAVEIQSSAKQMCLDLEKSVAEAKESLASYQTLLDEDEISRKQRQADKDERQKLVQALELERQNLKFQVDELAQIVQERYQLSLQEMLQSLEVQNLSPEEEAQQASELSTMEERAKILRDRIARFGDVNLVALQEYEDMKKRLDFMNHQKADLLRTLDSLQSIIDRINQITEFRFRETFKAINHNFQILFPKLFGGGKAYMSLTNESNLLESGVEIFAEPPGKKIQAMSLLSGGEKAMTSISLLFSLFSYRPSSFCILDEVDAPLDDINTRRYNEIIQEMSGLSQFIVITHNKRTMEVAETLFGVTMQEPGVSKLVGVNLQEARAFSGTDAAQAS